MTAEIALVHWHLGERDLAVTMLESGGRAAAQASPHSKRSLAFALVAEIAATIVGRRELAVECVQLGRSSVTPAPRSAGAAPARNVKPAGAKASTPDEMPAFGAPATAPSVGRRRVKGPVRRLSVLISAGESNPAEPGPAQSTRPWLAAPAARRRSSPTTDRLPADVREEFIAKYRTTLYHAYGIVQKEYRHRTGRPSCGNRRAAPYFRATRTMRRRFAPNRRSARPKF
jgi:hypothetical protein